VTNLVSLLNFRSNFDLNESAPDAKDHRPATGRNKFGAGATMEVDSTQQLMARSRSFSATPMFGNY
jgi:hypothetical protein